MLETIFIASAVKQFRDYKSLGEKTMAQLNEADMHYEPVKGVNSIAVNITHLHGNMLSRWTNFLTEDGEKEWRQRDDEFEVHDFNKSKLLVLWEQGWQTLFNAIEPLQPGDLKKTIYIRTRPLTVADAIHRQLTHYAYHVGQIVLLGKIIRGNEWKSLSIPRGQSQQYLDEMKKKP